MAMITVLSRTMRDLDRKTIAEFDISGEALMERAGKGVAENVYALVRQVGLESPLVRFVAGRGNNGGDAFAAACSLKERGLDVDVWLACDPSDVRGDAIKHFARVRSARIPVEKLPTMEDWQEEIQSTDLAGCVIVDGVLGIGITGPARGPAAGAIAYINKLAQQNFVVSIDIPSGLNGDTGDAPGDAVRADITVTMGLPKTGLVQPSALEYVGVVEVCDIGIPRQLWEGIRSDEELITAADFRDIVKRRPRKSHKGDYGHVLVIAGSAGHLGAAGLACLGAVCSGAGLITAIVPQSAVSAVLSLVPEAMVHGGKENESGGLRGDVLDGWLSSLKDFTAVVAGPGLSTSPDTFRIVQTLLDKTSVPIVLDADALNVFAGKLESFGGYGRRVILTPHPGEMGRLLGITASEVQNDRFKAIRKAAAASGSVVVLKGAGSLVAMAQSPVHVNLTGNPGMARGGMGDLLAGLIAGLASQGMAPLEAARLGVYLHGRGGDLAAWRGTQMRLRPMDLAESIMYAWRELTLR